MSSRRSKPRILRLTALSRGLSALLAVLSAGAIAAAQQTEAEKPAPNVLLLVDSSGSMEFKTNGEFPTCTPGDTNSEKSRWIDLVEVMTGTIDPGTYSCWAQDRSSPEFQQEFSLDGQPPYDFGYVNPYHRALSNSCLYGPGVPPASSSPFDWPDRAVNKFQLIAGQVDRPLGAAALASHVACDFDQANDGLLDIYRDQVRFGLMTFDARVSAGTGVNGGLMDAASGMDGNWSYYLSSPVTGHPANCAFDMVQEVGARNAAAPPWEGRLIAFGPPGETDNTVRNDWIQEVLLSTRPYGATPIAGQLHDAREFLWNDTSIDPLDSAGTAEFGPSNDPNWRAPNCRKTILILLTDGEPNLDLRPFCEEEPPPPETSGRCPYEKPEDIVSALRSSPPDPSLSVETYVIGFALGRVTPFNGSEISCGELTDVQCADPANNDPEAYPESTRIQACCTLNEIAAAGGFDSTGAPRKAYFAENRTQLRAIFTDILDDVVQVATRTMPVFTSAGGDTQSNGFKFFSAFNPQPNPEAAELWEGVLERKRFVCNTSLVPEERFDPARGDDFAANVNSGIGDARWFYTVVAEGDNRNTIRPFMTTADDGLAPSDGEQVFADQPGALPSLVPPAAMQVTGTSCDDAAATAEACRDLILQHAVGLTNLAGETRCPDGDCRLLGGIYHSIPTVVPGRPNEQLRDDSYDAFIAEMAAEARSSALYVSTVDGFLHAFNLAPFPGSVGAADREIDERINNELWSFIPPAVLPVMQTQYPRNPAILLDGVPIIKDVVAFDDSGTERFERTPQDAEAGTGLWKTVLVQGFGEGQVSGGYFAIDITKPDRTDGPVFRWQLTRDADGTPLFGSAGTPLITTLFLETDAGNREVAVAVLPGGEAAPATTATGPAITDMMTTDPSDFEVLRPGRDYTGREAARSLTIVRLDTGEVIRTFRPASGAGPFATSVFTATDIPAPITGQPKAFPEVSGAVADRIFVGDRDGRMWRVDVSSTDPSDWTMQVFHDAFHDGTFESSQPVRFPPVLSVNDDGLVTVAYATGDERGTGTENRVVSLTEEVQNNEFVTKVNWVHTLTDGERVTGPMVLFNRGLYYAASRLPDTTTAACDVGRSKVFGAHYEQSLDVANEVTTPDPMNGPDKAPGASNLVIASRSDGMIFGVSLDAEPTCAEAEETIDGNSSFGYGNVTMSTEVNPGRFFLTFEVSGSSADSRGVLEVRQQLDSPRVPVTFQSWALVYE